MAEASARTSRWRRWTLGLPAAVLLVLVVALGVVHTPVVRRIVLRRAIVTLQDRLHLRLTAASLSYNLLALRISLADVVLAGETTADLPFAHAARVSVDLPWSSLLGRFAIDDVVLADAAVHVVRRRDGTTNLPKSGDTGGTPSALPVGRIRIQDLRVDISDEPSSVELSLPRIAVDVAREKGSVRLLGEGTIARVRHTTRVQQLEGDVAFDGRALRFDRLRLVMDEGSMNAQGTLALLVDSPSVDLNAQGSVDAQRVSAWFDGSAAVSGAVAFRSHVAGPLDAPNVSARAEAGVAGGRIVASGDYDIGRRTVDANAEWSGIDTARLVKTLAPEARPYPSGVSSGTARVRGSVSNLLAGDIAVRNETRAGVAGRDLVPASGTVQLDVADHRWSAAARYEVLASSVDATLAGRLNAATVRESTLGGRAHITASDLTALLSALRRAGLLSADVPVTSGSGDADVRVAGTLQVPSIDASIRATNLDVGAVRALSVTGTGKGTLRELAIDVVATQDANTIRAVGVVSPARSTLDVALTGSIADLHAFAPDVPLGGVVQFRAQAAGSFDAPRAQGTLTIAEARYGTFAIGQVDSTIEIDGTEARVHAEAPDLSAQAQGSVKLAVPHVSDVDVTIDNTDLARLARDQIDRLTLTGRASMRAHAAGPIDNWRSGTASIDVSSFDARANDLNVRLSRPATISYQDRRLRLQPAEIDLGGAHANVSGALPMETGVPGVEADGLIAVVTGDSKDVLEAVKATGLVDVPAIEASGPIELHARARGSIARPVIDGDLVLGPASVAVNDVPAATNVDVRLAVDGGWLELRGLTGTWQGSAVSARARVPLRFFDRYLPEAISKALPATTGPASLIARADALTPQVLEPFVDPETLAQLKGTVGVAADFQSDTATIEDLRGELRVDRLDIEIGGLPVRQREPTRIVADHGFARVAAWNWDGQGATLAVKGQVRLADRQAGILADGRIDLRTLGPFVRAAGVSTAGTLEPHVSITGAIENPRIDGDVALTNGEVRLAEPRVAVTDLTGRAVLSLNGARITSLRGGINGGTLTGTGQVDYRRNEAVTATMAVNVHDAALEFPEGLRSAVDADLALNYVGSAPAVKGPLDVAEPAHGALSGTVTVAHSSYRQPLALATGLLSALRNRRVAAAAQPEQDALANHLALDVRLLTEDDVVVDNNYGRLQMGADLRVIGTAAAPALSGRAELREGGQLFLGRNIYTIDTGTIDFANPVTIEPELNIVATTRAGGEEIELPIKGTPDNLDMSPRSLTTPELATADVWSVLLIGRRLDEISGDEAQVVGEQVLSYLSGDVLGMASRAVGLDTIRLGGLDRTTLRWDPTAVVAEIDPTSRMTFGKSIGRDVDLTFSQSLVESDGQTWIVDYRPMRQLELRLVSDDDNLRSYEFRHDVPFGARARGYAAMPVVRRRSTAPRVAAVEFAGTLAVPAQQLRARLHVKEGDRLDYAEWQRDRDRIESFYWSEGRLEARISARTRETNDAVTLAYEIEAGPATSVVVTGATLARETLAVLRDAWAHSVFDGFLQDEARDVVRRAMAEDGYLRAEVTAAVSAGNGEKTLTVTVSPGDRTTERRMRVTAAGVENADIERWMRNQRLDVAVWREPGRVQRDIEAHLRADGHLRTAVNVGGVIFEGSAATVPIEVDTGPVFTIGRVALRGAGGLSEADVIGASSLASGMIHDPAAIESARQRIIALYRREGFASVKVTASAQARTDVPQVDVTFDVVEAPRQVLGEIVVEGNRAIEQDVVVRAMRLETNEPLGIDAWLQARKRVFDTGLFRRVDVSTEPAGVSGDAGVQPMRVRVVVEEWPPLRFRYGIRAAEERPTTDINGRNLTPGLSAEVTRRTLFGRAIAVGGAGVYQHRQRYARGFIGAPTFWGAPIQSSLTMERSHEDIASATLVTDSNSAAWEQRMTFIPRLQLSYSYGFERNHTFDTSPPANSFLPAFDISINIARLNGAAAFDTRNDPTETTRGSLLTGSVEYTPQALGSDIWFVKFVGQAYHFRPWKRLVFASAARVGAMRPLGGQELLTSEKFFTGGARSVRGVDEDSLGPQNVFDEPSGGGALLVLNQEVRFPVFKWLRGVGFLDAGNVFAAPSDLRVSDLVGSGGIGARLTTPFGTFRVDYGKRWSTGAGRWTFGIGQTF